MKELTYFYDKRADTVPLRVHTLRKGGIHPTPNPGGRRENGNEYVQLTPQSAALPVTAGSPRNHLGN